MHVTKPLTEYRELKLKGYIGIQRQKKCYLQSLLENEIVQTFNAMQDANIGKLETLKGGRLQFVSNENILKIANKLLSTQSSIVSENADMSSKNDTSVPVASIVVRAGKIEVRVASVDDAVRLVRQLQ